MSIASKNRPEIASSPVWSNRSEGDGRAEKKPHNTALSKIIMSLRQKSREDNNNKQNKLQVGHDVTLALTPSVDSAQKI